MLFDRCITFYTLKASTSASASATSANPEAIVMGDIADPFLPVHQDRLFIPMTVACSASGLGLIAQLRSTFAAAASNTSSGGSSEITSPLCCFGAAVQCGIEAVGSRGGRCLFFLSSLTSAGPGALKNRSADPTIASSAPTDKASPMLFPQHDFYSKAGKKAAELGVSLSLCLSPTGYCDLSTIGGCVEFSSGRVFYQPSSASSSASGNAALPLSKTLSANVFSWLSQPFAFDCLARIRCASGLQVKKHYGHFTLGANGNDLSFGGIDADTSLTALLEYDGKLNEREGANFQVACLYTHPGTGQRRIRVLNLALPVTTAMATVFRMAELDSILSFYVKKNISQRLEAPAAAFPASLTAKCVAILAAYRRYCAANMSAGQLILPDSLKLLPVLTLAATKDPAFNTLPNNPDTRAFASLHLMSAGMQHYLEHFYPRLYPFDVSGSGSGSGSADQSGKPVLQACLRLSREHLRRDGIYLLCNGHEIVLYVGDAVPGDKLHELFGQSLLNACHLQPDSHQLPVLNNSRSAHLRETVSALRTLAGSPLPLRLVRQSVDVAEEAQWSQWLVEDSSPAGASYVDYLCRVHSQIQQVIAQGVTLSLAERTSMLNFFH